MGLNPGLHGERPATSRLSHGTAMKIHISAKQHSTLRLRNEDEMVRTDYENNFLCYKEHNHGTAEI